MNEQTKVELNRLVKCCIGSSCECYSQERAQELMNDLIDSRISKRDAEQKLILFDFDYPSILMMKKLSAYGAELSDNFPEKVRGLLFQWQYDHLNDNINHDSEYLATRFTLAFEWGVNKITTSTFYASINNITSTERRTRSFGAEIPSAWAEEVVKSVVPRWKADFETLSFIEVGEWLASEWTKLLGMLAVLPEEESANYKKALEKIFTKEVSPRYESYLHKAFSWHEQEER